MCKWSMMQSEAQKRKDADAQLIASYLGEKSPTACAKNKRTVASSDMKLAVRGDITL
jgi:hypothetical protein